MAQEPKIRDLKISYTESKEKDPLSETVSICDTAIENNVKVFLRVFTELLVSRRLFNV